MRKINPPNSLIVFLSMMYISLFFASMSVGYKIVSFGSELYCASAFIFPLLFPFSDAIAEIYGPEIVKNMIIYTAICEMVFVLLTNVSIRLPSPANWHHQAEYDFIIGGYIHILLANITAMAISFYLNVRLLRRWYIVSRGRYYYIRSLGATAVGEIVYTIITNIIAYMNKLSGLEIANIIVSDYIFKIIYSAIIAYPAALFVLYIKKNYGSKNHLESFNPFQYRDFRKIVSLKAHDLELSPNKVEPS